MSDDLSCDGGSILRKHLSFCHICSITLLMFTGKKVFLGEEAKRPNMKVLSKNFRGMIHNNLPQSTLWPQHYSHLSLFLGKFSLLKIKTFIVPNLS